MRSADSCESPVEGRWHFHCLVRFAGFMRCVSWQIRVNGPVTPQNKNPPSVFNLPGVQHVLAVGGGCSTEFRWVGSSWRRQLVGLMFWRCPCTRSSLPLPVRMFRVIDAYGGALVRTSR